LLLEVCPLSESLSLPDSDLTRTLPLGKSGSLKRDRRDAVGSTFYSHIVLLQKDDDNQSDDLSSGQSVERERERGGGTYNHGDMATRADVSATGEGREGTDILRLLHKERAVRIELSTVFSPSTAASVKKSAGRGRRGVLV
jgi:hypothetical protein